MSLLLDWLQVVRKSEGPEGWGLWLKLPGGNGVEM